MIVAVGSQNPAKLEAVRLGFLRIWPDYAWTVRATKVKSNVSEQPLSDEEMIAGSEFRAKSALNFHSHADYGVGLEGGLHRYGEQWFGRSWISVVSRNGKLGIASTVSCLIPAPMMKLVHQGKTMSEVCEILYGDAEIGKKNGYYGLLTNNVITRSIGYADGVVMALAVFARPEMY
jgi:inosine/xanthosine triphosphatase